MVNKVFNSTRIKRKKIVLVLCLALIAPGWAGIKGEGSNSAAQQAHLNVYFGSSGKDAKGIYHAIFDTEKGKLSEAELAAEISEPGFLTLHPDKQKLYALGQLDGQSVVAGYNIGSSGQITHFTTSPITDGNGTHIAVHPSARFLLSAQYGTGSIALFPLDEAGNLGTAAITRHEGGSNVVPDRQDKAHPHWCGFSPDGQYAFVPDLGMDGIVIYRVDADKRAIHRQGFVAAEAGGGARHMRFSTDGKFIYLLNEMSLSVTTFKYDSAAGNAVRLSNTPALTEQLKAGESFNAAAEILVHPNGLFIYSSNRGNDSVTAYRADSKTGFLTVSDVEPIRGSWPRNINMDPAGNWLLAAGRHSNTISVHAIDPSSGVLTFQQKSIINVPGPMCILFAN